MTNTREMLTDQMRAQVAEFDSIYDSENPYEGLFEAPLEVTLGTTSTVLLCTGEPHVEVVASLDSERRVVEARVDGHWAGAKESWRVQEDSPLFRAMNEYVEWVI